MTWLHLVIPTLILVGATFTDLKNRKIYNWYILSSAALGIAHTLYFFGTQGLLSALAAAGLALVLMLPLVLAKVMGAGDMKIMVAFGLASSYGAVLSVIIYGLVWSLVFGLIYVVVRGEVKEFVGNLRTLAFKIKPDGKSLHRIPFTVGLLMGWVSTILNTKIGGLL